MNTVEKEWVGRVERVALKHTSVYVKETASWNLLYDAGSSKAVLCDNLEGWDRVEGGREAHEGGVYAYLDSHSC